MHAHRVMAVHIQTMSLQFFDLQTDTKTDTLAKRKEQYVYHYHKLRTSDFSKERKHHARATAGAFIIVYSIFKKNPTQLLTKMMG